MISTQQKRSILEQYASPSGRTLYRHVMGDGSDHIHYGLYADAATPMSEALAASSRRLLDMALTRLDGESLRDILDLGAGAGGTAKCLLSWTPARMTCVDLGGPPLRDLERWAAGAGLSSRLRAWQGSFGRLPAAWAGTYDLVWSQEALCHAPDRLAVFSEARRVLRPGGALVFSDILLAEDAPEAEARAFTSVNAVQQMGTLASYSRELRQAGFTDIRGEDWTPHLAMNFLRMRQQIERRRPQMLEEGVSPDSLDRFADALDQRLRWPSGRVLQWHAWLCAAD